MSGWPVNLFPLKRFHDSSRVPAERIERVGGVVAATALVAMALLRVARNLPAPSPAGLPVVDGVVSTLALVVPAGLLLAIGVANDSLVRRLGLVVAGVFGLATAVAPAAGVPAAGAVVAGGAVAVADRVDAGDGLRRPVTPVVAGCLLGAAAVSLGSTSGVLPPPSRAAGSALAMVGLAGTSALVTGPRIAWLAGGAALVAVLAAGVAAPFITGATFLVVVGAIGLPLLLIGLGLAGGVTAAVRSALAGRRRATIGAVCLLAVGVPATVPRAVGAVLGLYLLIGGDGRG